MQIRIIQWNISFMSKIPKIVEFIRKNITENCIVNLQEVTDDSFNFIKENLSDNAAFSLIHRPPGRFEGKNRKMGVATLCFGGSIEKSSLLNESVFPDRTLITEVSMDKRIINNFAFHSLTGCDYKKAKSSNFASIVSFLNSNEKIDFFSCDANEPNADSINDEQMTFYDNQDKGKNAQMLFGDNKAHCLTDSYKQYVRKTGEELSDGFTFITGKTKRRYDHIYHNQIWEVINAKSLYKESLEASSDHAMVICDYTTNN
ncbi:MAG: hypothetical protein GXZ18_05495 [Synergistaceae bacterium]|nr:hypothetical protein [Synergistaceae bacterium]